MNNLLYTLYLYYGVYFVGMGFTTYAPKYYGAIGLSNSQIGLINAVPAFIAIFAQPLWGMLADRSRCKKNAIVAGLLVAGVCALAAEWCGNRFWLLLCVLTLLNTFSLPAIPVGNAIALEYTERVGSRFGPIRMTGTIGYQIGIIIIGVLLAEDLKGLYTAWGIVLLLSCVAAWRMPDIRGYQHGGKRVPFTALLKDKRVMCLLGLAFLVQTCTQFYLGFFSKHLGDIGMSNELTGVITILSVILEIPFLMVGDKLYKKLTFWQWLWIGMLLNGIRFFGLSCTTSPVAIIVIQILSVSHLACYEFFPTIFLSTSVDKELASTAQTVYQTVAYGAGRIVGTLLGGVLADAIGIASVFRAGGVLLIAAAVLTFVPLCRRMR